MLEKRLSSALGLAAAAVLTLSLVAGSRAEEAAEKTSANDPRLKALLERAPGADLNGDGVLTSAEAREFMARQKGGQGARLPAPTFANVRYGPAARNVLDFWKADSQTPAPVVVFFHGGGFVSGDKSMISPEAIRLCRAAGISIAAANYRFITTDPFPAPMLDGARAIQFIRWKAKEWGADPSRVAAYGGSAGAGMSLWLAFHDDLADAGSDDPVARESTRLTCAGSIAGQSSYNPIVISEWIGAQTAQHPSLKAFYGARPGEDLKSPRLLKLYDEASAITHLTRDDPPVWLFYTEPDSPLPANARPGQGIHHPIFGRKLKEAMDKLGIECVYLHNSEFKGNPTQSMVDFFIRHFGMEKGKSAAP